MEPEKKSNGALVGLVIIIIILVVGGIYMWQSNQNPTETMQGTQMQSGTLTSQDSVELNTLEQDAKTTDPSTGVDVNSVQ